MTPLVCALENYIFFADATGLTGLVLSILSVLSPSDSNNCKEFLLRGKACCTLVFGPPVPLVDFAIRDLWCGFFDPENCKDRIGTIRTLPRP